MNPGDPGGGNVYKFQKAKSGGKKKVKGIFFRV
jgi:hypothetical protein